MCHGFYDEPPDIPAVRFEISEIDSHRKELKHLAADSLGGETNQGSQDDENMRTLKWRREIHQELLEGLQDLSASKTALRNTASRNTAPHERGPPKTTPKQYSLLGISQAEKEAFIEKDHVLRLYIESLDIKLPAMSEDVNILLRELSAMYVPDSETIDDVGIHERWSLRKRLAGSLEEFRVSYSDYQQADDTLGELAWRSEDKHSIFLSKILDDPLDWREIRADRLTFMIEDQASYLQREKGRH